MTTKQLAATEVREAVFVGGAITAEAEETLVLTVRELLGALGTEVRGGGAPRGEIGRALLVSGDAGVDGLRKNI